MFLAVCSWIWYAPNAVAIGVGAVWGASACGWPCLLACLWTHFTVCQGGLQPATCRSQAPWTPCDPARSGASFDQIITFLGR